MAQSLAKTGVEGLDAVLGGGLPRGHVYLVEGTPGAGKTTLALQFLLEGLRQGESVLYVTLSETKSELEQIAGSHGWRLGAMSVHEIRQDVSAATGEDPYTVFHPSEVELAETTKRMLSGVEQLAPARVVIDSLSELRLLSYEPLRYRRQILGLKEFFTGRECTVLMLDDCTVQASDLQPRSIAHGVMELEQVPNEYGAERRRLRVAKLRGTSFTGGYHDFSIVTGGLSVFPRLAATAHRADFDVVPVSTGLSGFDTLLGGGLDRGTTTLFTGPAGTGKSSVAMKVVSAAAGRGEHAAVFAFEEDRHIVARRAHALKDRFEEHVDAGSIAFRHIDAAEMSPGEFAAIVRRAVERDGARVVVIDSLNGYLNAMPEEQFLTAQLHELMGFLNNQGVVAILVLALQGLLGTNMSTRLDVSYLTDTVVVFRHFEADGMLHKAVSVLKKRTGRHEHAIRELRFDERGLEVGECLTQFQGILTGVPTFVGEASSLSRGDA